MSLPQTATLTDESLYNRYNQQVKDSFIRAGLALAHIRDKRLYEVGGYDSFAAYCKGEVGISESYASKMISGAIAAREVMNKTSINIADLGNKAVAYELHLVAAPARPAVALQAAELALSEGKPTITTAHVKRAWAELSGAQPDPVKRVADWLGVTDSEKIMILTRWFQKRTPDGHSKWDAVSASGVIDPGDDSPPVTFASATVREIIEVEKRWQNSRIVTNSNTRGISGRLSEAPIIDNQPVWGLAGKRVKITIIEEPESDGG